jgi:Ca-activated chloride channel family protein
MDINSGDLKLELTSLCNRVGLPAGDQPQPAYLLTQLGPNLSAVNHRLPLNIAVILDHSSSMMEDGLPVFKQALKDLVDQLQTMDHFSLVSLAGSAIIPAQPVQEKARLKHQIDQIAMTNQVLSAAGLAEGLAQAQIHRSPGASSRILLILGGELEASASELESLADQAGYSSIPISVIGFGNNWDDQRWIELADRSLQAPPGSLSGSVEYISALEEAAEAMQRVYRSLPVVARDVHLTMRFMRGVEVQHAWRVIPTIHGIDLPQPAGQAVVLQAAELSMEGAAYLLETVLPPRAAGQVRVAQMEVSYRSVDDRILKQSVDLVIEFSQNIGATNPLDSYVMNFVEMAQARHLNTAALEDLNAGNRQAAIQKFRQAAAILISQGYRQLADRIRGEADYNIRQYGQISAEGRKMILLNGRRVVNPEVG